MEKIKPFCGPWNILGKKGPWIIYDVGPRYIVIIGSWSNMTQQGGLHKSIWVDLCMAPRWDHKNWDSLHVSTQKQTTVSLLDSPNHFESHIYLNKDSSLRITPPKTNMTMEQKQPVEDVYILLKHGVFPWFSIDMFSGDLSAICTSWPLNFFNRNESGISECSIILWLANLPPHRSPPPRNKGLLAGHY